VFLGQYQHNVDDKGRVVMPAKFREGLEHGLVVTKGQERCVYVFPLDRWEEEVAKVNRCRGPRRRIATTRGRSLIGHRSTDGQAGARQIRRRFDLRRPDKDVVVRASRPAEI
jgi:division/cell wall cluster transcriptional repressor MraZ